METHYRYDCRHFTGYKPCPWDCECDGCPHYEPMGPRVLVARVHQLGNIVKSTPVLHALRKRFDEPWIEWLAGPAAVPLLAGNPLVDRVLEYRWETAQLLMTRRYDLVVSLEANAEEAALAQRTPGNEHVGFGVDETGALRALGEGSEDYVALSVSDRLRFEENDRTLAELCFELVGVPYEGEEYVLCPSDGDRAYAREVLDGLGLEGGGPLIGLATGGNSARFETKDWPLERFRALAEVLDAETDAKLVLLGGPAECEANARLAGELQGIVRDSGCKHEIMQFCALLGLFDVVVSADAFPLHAAVGMGTPVVGVFGPTPPAEVAIFGRGRKVVTEMECAPCYIRRVEECPHTGECMAGITPQRVARTVLAVLKEECGTGGEHARRESR